MLTIDELFGKCPYATSQKLLSGKWALMILHSLSEGKLRFNQLQKLMPEITQTTLTRQLRQLEDYNIIVRTVYPQVPPKVEYELSSIGYEFCTVLDALKIWGDKYIDYNKQMN